MADKNKKASALIGVLGLVVFGFIGGIFLLITFIFNTVNKNLEERCTEKTTAVVTELKENSDGGTYAPVFTFTADDKVYSVAGNSYSNPPKYDEGDEVEIYYDPSQPRTVYDPNDKVMKIVTTVFSVIGFTFVGIGVVIFIIMLVVGAKSKTSSSDDEMAQYYK